MKLESNDKWPPWLKRDPRSGIWRVVSYRADKRPRRLDKSTKERVSIKRAETLGRQIYEKWLGHRVDGSKLRPLFGSVCEEALDRMEAKYSAGKIRKATIDNARLFIGRKIRDEFGHLYVDQITEGGIWGGFVARFQRENPGAELYTLWKHMGAVMKHAYRCGYRDRPWEAENPDPTRAAGRVLTEAEKTRLLEVAPPNLKDELILAMTMGMRLREILKLEWARVDFERGTIALFPEHVKTKKGRVMAMSPQARLALTARAQGLFMACDGYVKRRKIVGGPFVFPSRGNANKPTNQNKTAWRRAKERAGITGRCKFHHLRHTFLTDCANLLRSGTPGISVVHVCAYAGLSIRTFERVYLHLNHEDTCGVSKLVTVNLRESKNSAETNK